MTIQITFTLQIWQSVLIQRSEYPGVFSKQNIPEIALKRMSSITTVIVGASTQYGLANVLLLVKSEISDRIQLIEWKAGASQSETWVSFETMKDLSRRAETVSFRSKVIFCSTNDNKLTSDIARWAVPTKGIPQYSRSACRFQDDSLVPVKKKRRRRNDE